MRIRRARALMKRFKIDLLLIEKPIDVQYLSGLVVSSGTLLLHQSEVLFALDGRYLEIAKKTSPWPVIEAKEEMWLSLFCKPKWRDVRVIGVDRDAMSYGKYCLWKQRFMRMKKQRRLKTRVQLKALSSPISALRMIKEEKEIYALEKSAHLLWEGFSYLCKTLQVGISEKEAALAFEMHCRKKGASGVSFAPIIAFGENSAFPHHISGDRRLKMGEIVLVDIGLIVDHYASDMTRIIFFGNVSEKLRTLFRVVKKAQQAALALCGPGIKGSALDQAARDVMAEAGLEEYYLHSLGHGIGLEVHEPPRLSILQPDIVLEPGMVVSIEPGLYLPGIGGVRYEDMVGITEEGCQKLTRDVSS